MNFWVVTLFGKCVAGGSSSLGACPWGLLFLVPPCLSLFLYIHELNGFPLPYSSSMIFGLTSDLEQWSLLIKDFVYKTVRPK